MSNQTLMQRLEKIQMKLTRVQLQLSDVMAGRQFEKPIQTQWIRPKAASVLWSRSDSTLRKYRTKKWTDGSYNWIEGVHWKKRKGYNRAVVDHWFAHRWDHEAHQDFINNAYQVPKGRMPLDVLLKDLKIEQCRFFELNSVLTIQCEDPSECGRVWRRYYALWPQGWDITLRYGPENEFYGTTQSSPQLE
ncbi:MAG: hypothetical protein AAGI45_11030 [Cyanobacteria bacterium P01_H01_bin.26]